MLVALPILWGGCLSFSPDNDAPIELDAGDPSILSFVENVSGYTGTLDTYVDESRPAATPGTLQAVIIDGGALQQFGLLKFSNVFEDEGGPVTRQTDIAQATLELAVTNSGGLVNVHVMLVDWDEAGSLESISSLLTPGVHFAIQSNAALPSDASGVISIDVTTDVVAFAAEGSSRGWLFAGIDGREVRFYSREGMIPPKLTVNLAP